MIKERKNLAYIIALSTCAALMSVSCAKSDADKVGEAQLCLDKATKGTAAACLEKIEGIDSPGAHTMRCSAGFIDEGFTEPTRLKNALKALSEKSGGDTNTLEFLAYIAFSSKGAGAGNAAANKAFAAATYDSCVKSKAKGLTLLGSMAMTATTLASVAGGITEGSGTDIKQAITDLIAANDDASKSAIGSAVISTYETSCSGTAPANQGLCDQLNSYLAGAGGAVDLSDPLTVGNAILDKWKDLNPPP